ncbi:MAG: HD domain-containing protein [Candidatus Bathyarchaeota archaeon]|nr:MAG: HD domain-containing protein [Candidatus Bathyarchaeota archaeon]
MDVYSQIKKKVMKSFLNAKGSHDWDHTERVQNLCMRIGRKENADLEILKYAAVLHDIGRDYQDRSDGKYCHAERGAILARGLLEKYEVDRDKIKEIVHCIESHRFRGNKIPQSIEAKVLFDADKLDSIGAVGIGRAFLFAGEVGAKLHNKNVDIEQTKPYTKEDTAYREFMVKLRKVKQRILTEEGKKIAENRHRFMTDFFDRLKNEIDGIM